MSAPTEPNAELAYKVIDRAHAKPNDHDQAAWIRVQDCGTTACFAGWASLLSGDEPFVESFNGYTDQIRSVETGRVRFVRTRAIALLGITDRQADRLFDACNTREELAVMVAEIFGPRPDGAS